MSQSEPSVPVPGSEPVPLDGATVLGQADLDTVIDVSVVLRPCAAVAAAGPFGRDEARTRFTANTEHLDRLTAFASSRQLGVVDVRAAARTVRLRGALADFSLAFGVGFERHAHPDGNYRAQIGPVHVPSTLSGAVLGVLGLDDRPLVFHMAGKDRCGVVDPPKPTPIQHLKLLPDWVARYNLPEGDGGGQYIGVLCFGGGFTQDQASSWFSKYKLPVPDITWKGVDGGTNKPTPSEPVLDIHVLGEIAPGAKIVAYFAPFTAQGIHDAITTALDDGATILSMSFAGQESRWSASDRACVDLAIDAADAAGVTLCVSSGDCGAKFVYYPGSSPNALACGGTMIVDGESDIDEQVWNNAVGSGWMASSGGISAVYAVPDFQFANGIEPVSIFTGKSGRGVPDVAGPAMGVVMANGALMVGTSVAAPFLAALLARLNQALGTDSLAGFKTALYQWSGSSAFHPITVGTNAPPGGKGYLAGTPWNACTGLGTPDCGVWLTNLRESMNRIIS